MMALTMAQPHATLAAHGWKTGYRGPVAIYAARWRAGLDRRAFKALCLSDPFHDPLYEALLISRCADLHYLRLNKDGSPEHPLYIPADTAPRIYAPPVLPVAAINAGGAA